MNSDMDEQIRARAYQIWEEEGRPHGRHDEHWRRAAEELGVPAAPSAEDNHPGMFGDGTEEQNLNQTGTPGARITEDEVEEAFQSATNS
jgi:hypothetical protein